ncbi:type II restriction endonuclease NgoMIV (plasmid) [Mycobacterium sp. 20KCMC460]|uniref:NgoMIV family type II restriction endonuclease n=1 Tax=Mycobacterium kiyosense TaxID=2871094 RepID=UPI00222F9F0A|nr:NgoMIV family type II restriction endonuclease [Mycobacterium kiyosense]BDE17451.1 type II restriction endonuclease NgoMIV [Mycobacterium sp. 20KCMC460]GLC23061.1 type II restriction endonuclease NgoMIV [Mycobacterium kiyosense]
MPDDGPDVHGIWRPCRMSRDLEPVLSQDYPVAGGNPTLGAAVMEAGSPAEAYFAEQRSQFHAGLLLGGTLSVGADGIASNADRSSPLSRSIAAHIAAALKVETERERAAGQTSGGKFEEACATFLAAAFNQLGHLRPGEWSIHKVPSRGAASGVARYEQYSHLVDLADAVENNPSLAAILGNAYAIAPDVVVSRATVSDDEINAHRFLVDETVATHASLRTSVQPNPLLHAVVSCKWTLRSDRAQNARSEALNLIRNRKGRLPHVVVVTGEPTPVRISSLALGTGDIDCVYHFALPELVSAVRAEGGEDTKELLDMMIQGKRLKDIADLPLDLAV